MEDLEARPRDIESMASNATANPSFSAFKAYDIRGRVPEQLNPTLAERIGSELSEELGPGPVVLGRDARLSSPELQAALAHGVLRTGRDVIDIGLCGTEEVYFQTNNLGAAGGVMITASHNPIDFNGMKLVREGSRPISGDSGLNEIRDRSLGPPKAVVRKEGVVQGHPDKDRYIRHLLGYVDPTKLRPLKIVANSGNGTAGLVLDKLAALLPFEFVRIQHEPDGTFPHGIPNPLLPDSRQLTADAVVSNQADFGIAWDGDFDRCFFFDSDGRFIEGYYIVGLLASTLLAKHPGAKVIHDPRLIWNTLELVLQAGGEPVMSKTGHAFIKERMRRENALYGGEMSAHHYFRDFAFCDSGMIPWLLIAELLSTSNSSLAECIDARMKAYPCSGEINFTVADAAQAMRSIQATYAALQPEVDYTDGYSADFGEWRMNLRCSNTEPLLRLNVEARGNASLVEERVAEIGEQLKAQST